MRYFALCLFLLLPHISQAAIIFSEIAWMGDSESANYEWIELQNTGDTAVDVEGWTIVDTGTLNISLTGTIEPSAFVVLERNRTSGVYLTGTPFLVYTGALVNTGTTLTLKRSDGSIEDQVAGGENWEALGGDNTTKDTAQYTSSLGWITAPRTPKAVNATTPSPTDDGDDEEEEYDDESTSTPKTTSSGSTKSSKATETVRLGSIKTILKLTPDIQSTAYVNQPIKMNIVTSGVGDTVINSLKYEWNFGDMATGTGKTPTHVYAYPGTYVITVRASFAEKVETVRHSITILPVTISLQRLPDGALQILNNAPYDVDISNYQLGEGEGALKAPPRTIIAARGSITVPSTKVPKTTQLRLYDAKAVVVAVWPALKVEEAAENMPLASLSDSKPTLAATFDVVDEKVPLAVPSEPQNEPFEAVSTTSSSSMPNYVLAALADNIKAKNNKSEASTAVPNESARWPYLALVGLILLVIFALVASRPNLGSSEDKINA